MVHPRLVRFCCADGTRAIFRQVDTQAALGPCRTYDDDNMFSGWVRVDKNSQGMVEHHRNREFPMKVLAASRRGGDTFAPVTNPIQKGGCKASDPWQLPAQAW